MFIRSRKEDIDSKDVTSSGFLVNTTTTTQGDSTNLPSTPVDSTMSSFPAIFDHFITASSKPNLDHSPSTNFHIKSTCCPKDVESSKRLQRPWRNKGRRKMFRLGCVFLLYTAGLLLLSWYRVSNSKIWHDSESHVDFGSLERMDKDLGRYKRDADPAKDNLEAHTKDNKTLNCTPRSVHNFPDNFLSFEETRKGGVIIHIIIALYMFAALAVVCDDYFVPALEHICEDLGLQADVAGATFMAAGSSAPEFMTSVVGVFFAQSDVGVGTIVGSAVFNILFIIGVCGVFAGMVVELTWYPLVRDTVFYLLSVFTLTLVIMDQTVSWYEALLMVLLYFMYILIMYFNRYLETRATTWVTKMLAKLERQPLVEKPTETHIIPDEMKRARAHRRVKDKAMELLPLKENKYVRFDESNSRLSTIAAAEKAFNQEIRISQSSLSISMSREYEKPSHGVDQVLPEEQETSIHENNTESATPSISSSKNGELMTVSEFQSMWTIPESFLMKCVWVLTVPIKCVFYVTIPDSRRPGIWARLYLISFIMSVAWISGLTYIMVWMVTITGDAFDIPDTVMGLTLLAAGTSVPDCLASVFVARDGYGDMAVSNSLGSNVFDILLCLGIPWLIECSINSGESVTITSGGLIYASLTLLGTVVFLLASMGINKWKLTKGYGVLCLVTYVMVVTLSCLYELNIFGDFNLPTCAR